MNFPKHRLHTYHMIRCKHEFRQILCVCVYDMHINIYILYNGFNAMRCVVNVQCTSVYMLWSRLFINCANHKIRFYWRTELSICKTWKLCCCLFSLFIPIISHSQSMSECEFCNVFRFPSTTVYMLCFIYYINSTSTYTHACMHVRTYVRNARCHWEIICFHIHRDSIMFLLFTAY